MKKYSVKYTICLICLFMASVTITFAQKGNHKNHNRIAHLQSELELTDEQTLAIKEAGMSMRQQMKELRKSGEKDRTQMQAIKNDFQDQLAEILTEEQLIKMEEMQLDRQAKMQEKKADRKAVKAELKAYRQENIQPVMLAQRKKLDDQISQEDQKLITELREVAANFKDEMKAKKEEFKASEKQHRAKGHHDKKGKKQHKFAGKLFESNEDFKTSAAYLSNKYGDAITALSQEIEADKARWKTDQKAIMEKHFPERTAQLKERKENGHQGRRHHKGKSRNSDEQKVDKQVIKHTMFLLMDSDQQTEKNVEIDETFPVNVYPNPGVGSQTIEFQTTKEGRVTIDLLNKSGQVVKSVFDGNLNEGTHRIPVTLDDQDKGMVYYYRINGPNGQVSKEIMILD